MFTGIIQAVGVVRSVRPQPAGARLEVEAPSLSRPISDGASVCVNGACLTVVRSDAVGIGFDVVPETLSRSTLGKLKTGDRVNLELSLRADGRLDGHIVQGHVDGKARVRRIERSGDGRVWTFAAGAELMPFIIPKGSVAVDGVSLTIARVEGDTFNVALIPTTLEQTTLGALRVGDEVNIETDIIARTVVTALRRIRGGQEPGGLTVELLREQGW
ncbi:MAG TPA: riboflavin synthase [Phycisphaerae bacterium]|nr:riboflavin synthase [Phycisphaerae bacterium]